MSLTEQASVHTLTTLLPSPIGDLLLTSDGTALTGLYMAPHEGRLRSEVSGTGDGPFRTVVSQLLAYFAGELTTFDVPTRASGTPFQIRVWDELSRIPYGETISYAELAHRVGSPNGYRAVGQANGRNPISIIIPCHRVIGADGALAGYGGGPDRKRFLLDLESPGRWLV